MTRTLVCLPLALLLTHCAPTPDPATRALTGTWVLTEQLADIGDGSGTYQPVDSDRKLVFQADGTVTSNFNFCNPIDGGTRLRSAKWSLEDGQLQPDCRADRPLPFRLEEGVLTLTPFCIEACGERYAKVE